MPSIPFERLLGDHGAAEVIGWAKTLRYFTFLGGYSSGPVDLYEELKLTVRFTGHAELVTVLETLGVLRHAAGQLPVTSNLVGGDQSVTAYPDLLQPLHQTVRGIACFLWVNDSYVTVTIAGSSGGVTTARMADALAFEALLDARNLGSRVTRTAWDDNAVSREQFPDRF